MEKLVEADLLEKTADEIKADKQAWLDRQARNKAKKDAAYKDYNKARYGVLEPIKDYLEKELSKFDKLEFNINVSDWYGEGIEVRINCNDRKLSSEDTALAWNYQAALSSEGEVKKETGSWSGLKACTEEQLDSLRQTVSALETLNAMDWASLLKVTLPDYRDYAPTDLEDETKDYDFDDELNVQQVRELMGTGKAIRVKNYHDDNRWARDIYIAPVRETAKKFEVRTLSAYYIDNGSDPKEVFAQNKWTEPVMKSKIKIVEPVSIIDVE